MLRQGQTGNQILEILDIVVPMFSEDSPSPIIESPEASTSDVPVQELA